MAATQWSMNKGGRHKYTGNKHEWEYLVHFDDSINLEPMWIDEITLLLLWSNREEINYMPISATTSKKKGWKQVDLDSLAFCHQCK